MELGQMMNASADTDERTSVLEKDKGANESKDAPKQICKKDTTTCPDGSVVRRNPEKNCEFDDCPDVRVNEMDMKKGILGLDYKQVLLIVALGIAGYFAYTKFIKK